MYIVLILISLCFSIYGYFRYIKKKKNVTISRLSMVSWLLSCIIFVLLMYDLPYFLAYEKEMDVRVKDIRIIPLYKALNLATIYVDSSNNLYWSGAPIGQENWLGYRHKEDYSRICNIKYLPLTRIVVEVTEDGRIEYNSSKDILTMMLMFYLFAFALVFSYAKESIVGKEKARKR